MRLPANDGAATHHRPEEERSSTAAWCEKVRRTQIDHSISSLVVRLGTEVNFSRCSHNPKWNCLMLGIVSAARISNEHAQLLKLSFLALLLIGTGLGLMAAG